MAFFRRKAARTAPGQSVIETWPDWTSYEPELLAPRSMMAEEGIHNLEEWFRWAEEWAMMLRIYGRAGNRSNVLEIGCGTGRIAFPLRYILGEGTYDGFDIRQEPVSWLQQNFTKSYPNFQFHFANLNNTHYNWDGAQNTTSFQVPAKDASMDLVYAASIFTHMLPENTLHYFREAARSLRPGGRCVFSFFLLDNYKSKSARHVGFSGPDFDFDLYLDEWGDEFAFVKADDVEKMTAYRLSLINRFAQEVGLEQVGDPLPGQWSGSHDAPLGAQDVVVLRKR